MMCSHTAASSGVIADAAPGEPWQERYDLDGDGRKDRVLVRYTGGAHCCYLMGVRLTSNGATVELPFEIDGGYVGGLDLGNPERFRIATDRGEPRLLLEIATYSGQAQPLPEAWTARYGITTHHIAVAFPGGELRVRDEAGPR